MGAWSADIPNLKPIPRPIEGSDLIRVDIDGKPFAATAQQLKDWLGGSGGGPSVFSWEPSSLTAEQFWSQMGFFAYDNDESLVGVTAVTYNGMTNREGIDLEECPDLVSFTAPNLTAITDGGYFELYGCPNLTTLDLPVLASLNLAYFSANGALAELALPSLVSCGRVVVNQNPNLVSLSCPVLASAADVQIQQNENLPSISFPNLTTIQQRLSIQFNLALETVELPALASATSGFIVYTNNSGPLADLYFPALVDASGSTLTISENSNLASVRFPVLLHVGTISIDGEAIALTDFSLLQDADTISLSVCSVLESISFPALARVTATFNAQNNSGLASLNCPVLQSVGTNLDIRLNPNLADVSIPALVELGVNCYGEGCALSETSVNAILARLVDCTTDGATPWANGVDLSGGASSAPSGQGITDAATLVGRGATVTTN